MVVNLLLKRHYRVEYYSAVKKNAFESVLLRWMNLEPITQSEVNQTKISYTDIYMESRKMVLMICFRGSFKGDADVSNRLTVTVEEGESRMT